MAEDDKKTAGRKGARAPVIDLKAEQVDGADKAKKGGKKTAAAKTAPPPGKAKKAPPKPAGKAKKTDATGKAAEEGREKPPQERKKKKSRKGLLAGLVLLLALLAAGVWFTPLKRYLPSWPPFAAPDGAKTAATDKTLAPAADEQPPVATPRASETPPADAAPTPGRDEPAKAGQAPQEKQSTDTAAPSGDAAPAGEERPAATATPAAGPDPAIQRELAALKERLRAQQAKLAALATLQQDIAALKEKTAAIDEVRNDIAALQKRLAALAANLDALKAAPATPPIGAAYAALRARVTAGQPYAEELRRLAALLPAAEGIDALQRHAEKGVPTRAMLKTRLDALITARTKPTRETATPGLMDRLAGKFSKLVKVRRVDQPDWPAALRQARSALDGGNVPAAIATLRKQPGQPPADIASWLAAATAHVKARAALTRLSDAVIAAMGRGG